MEYIFNQNILKKIPNKLVKTCFLCFIILVQFLSVNAQKNNTLFLVHEIPESNLLNPATKLPCKWYIGLPVLSSIHFNYANSTFSYNEIFTAGNGGYQPNLDGLTNNLHRRNSIATQLHLQLFALGYQYKKTTFYFTVTEKNNFLFTYPKNTILFLLKGNAQFIGETMNIKGTGVIFNHYREYAIGASTPVTKKLRAGIKAKLLFGKLNLSTKNLNLEIHTDPTTYNLDFSSKVNIRSSLPIIVTGTDIRNNSISYNDGLSPMQIALNRKNPGIAFDMGIIYDYSKNLTLSASIIDLGLIRWRSNMNQFEAEGEFQFQGVYNPGNSSYFRDLGNDILDLLNIETASENYTTYLPPKIMTGANYNINKYFDAGIATNLIFHRMKTMTSATFVGQFKPKPWLGLIGNYSIQNYSFNYLGGGFYIGRKPIQFYLISDNLLFIPKPYDTRNVNLRFGFNIIFGCPKKVKNAKHKKASAPPCFGVDDPDRKTYRQNVIPWEKQKKARKRSNLFRKIF